MGKKLDAQAWCPDFGSPAPILNKQTNTKEAWRHIFLVPALELRIKRIPEIAGQPGYEIGYLQI